ncbi:MAG: Gfo/Idh/MocA family protein [Bryobacteraceae bacterium]
MAQARRHFLRNSGAALVYQFVRGGFSLQAAGPNDQIGLGFIGLGIRGTQLFREFTSIPGVRPVAVADLYDGYLEHAREMAPTVVTTKDYHAVLARRDVDAVVIATPDHWHLQMALDALAAGKHVYVEKPLALNIEQGKRLVQAARDSSKLVMVGSQGKTTAFVAKEREIVQSGMLGRVTMVRMSNHRNNAQGAWVYPIPPDASPATIDWDRFLGPAAKRPFDARVFFRWRCWWEYSGGVATDLFVHLLTQLHEVMNVKAPLSAVSQGGLYRWNDGRTVPDVMESMFEYPGFMVDMYVNLCNSRPAQPTSFIGTEATMVEEGGKLVVYPEPVFSDVQTYGTLAWPKAMRAQYFESHGWTAEGRPKLPAPATKQPQVITVEEGPTHYEHFILSLRNGTPSRETAEEGHFAAAGAHIANIAWRERRRVAWNADTGEVS